MSHLRLDLSVIVPAYNEAARISTTLRRLHKYLSRSTYSYEIIVVLDGPTDNTRDVLKNAARNICHLHIVDRATNHGKGYTVREGMLHSSGRIRLFTDADNSTDIDHFEKMKPLFDAGCDLVIASRNPLDVATARQLVPQPWYRRVVGQMGNFIVRTIALPGIRDSQCGFKAFRAEAAERIFSQTRIDGWGFDIEVLVLARAMGFRTGMIPAQWIDDPRSHVRFSSYLRIFADTFLVRFNCIVGRYKIAQPCQPNARFSNSEP